ncbi:MAG: site-2 protease family protein [Archangium sp.]|nr:site-2 protease family protein [Archangium sp.]MDP3570729.1 site-2 protease family protein [Archangium sp.]
MWSWRFARVAGIELRVHLSFLLVILLGAWQWGGLGLRGAVFGIVLTLLTFASVTLHELGHSLVAKAFGIPVKDITLYPIGGVARLGRRPKTPGQEFLIAIAGPAVNVVLALGLGALALSLYTRPMLEASLTNAHANQPTLITLLAVMVLSNVVLAVFNMVPALPMDGGRVLRAVLSWFVGAEKATHASALIARVLAVGLMSVGLFMSPSNPMLVIIALFVFVGAGQEVNEQRLGRVLEGVQVADVVSPYAPKFSPATTLGEAVKMLTMTHYEAIAVEHFGTLLGVVTSKDILRAAGEQGAWGYIAGLVRSEVPTVEARDSLEVARFKMSEASLPFVAVLREGLFLGLVTEMELAVVADRLSSAAFRRDGAARVGQPNRIA